MSKKAKGKPWHSKSGMVYHDNSMCTEGKKVPPSERIEGTGQEHHCPQCGRLNNSP